MKYGAVRERVGRDVEMYRAVEGEFVVDGIY